MPGFLAAFSVQVFMAVRQEPLSSSAQTLESEHPSFDPRNPSDLRKGLGRIDGGCELRGFSKEEVEALREYGIVDLEKLHGKLKSITIACIEHGVFNEQEAKELRGLTNDGKLTPEELAEKLTLLLYEVLYRHLVEIQEKEHPQRSVLVRSAAAPDLEPTYVSKKPFDPRDDIAALARDSLEWISDLDRHKKDPNFEFLVKCLDEIVKKKAKDKERETKALDKQIRARFLGKTSYPGTTIIPEEPEA